jgi:hypothetical protein
MTFVRKHAAYVISVIAVVSGTIAIVSWWVPSSATWLNKHGFAAWPLALLFLLLFVWAASNWYQATQKLATVRAEMPALVPADRQLFDDFKAALPKDSHVIAWLRYDADTRMYRRSNIAPLSDFVHRWRDSDKHFVNPELEQAAQRFVECATDFLSYQGANAYTAPQRWQKDGEDTVFEYFSPNESNDRKRFELTRGLGERANKVLAAHNELYMVGSRLGL